MFPAVTVPFLFQAFALSQCSESSRILNLKTPYLIIAYLAPSLCSIPKVFAFLSQCWDTVSNGFTHVMWCHLILLKLNPTHRMNGKAEDLEKKASWNVKAYLFIHHRRAFTVVFKKKHKARTVHCEVIHTRMSKQIAKQSVFYSKLVFQGTKCWLRQWHSPFSASLRNFRLTICAYLTLQKCGLFCSLISTRKN